jgi:hypothetical protein
MTQIVGAIFNGNVLLPEEPVFLPANAKVRLIVEEDASREPLPPEMFWVVAPERPCPCEDCDEYLWFRRDAPVM